MIHRDIWLTSTHVFPWLGNSHFLEVWTIKGNIPSCSLWFGWNTILTVENISESYASVDTGEYSLSLCEEVRTTLKNDIEVPTPLFFGVGWQFGTIFWKAMLSRSKPINFARNRAVGLFFRGFVFYDSLYRLFLLILSTFQIPFCAFLCLISYKSPRYPISFGWSINEIGNRCSE